MPQQQSQRVVEELRSQERTFSFTLYRKHNENWGEGNGDQWWMSIPGIYQNGPERNPNSPTIIEHYWSCICDHVHDSRLEHAVERYLQASLLPVYNSRRAARVFMDSIPGKRDHHEAVNVLNTLLFNSRYKMMSEEEFCIGTVGLLRSDEIPSSRRQPSDELVNLYSGFMTDLLDEPKKILRDGEPLRAVALAQSTWNALRNRFGRRSGFLMQKIALDMIAYEGKAAFHHCYSNLWENLIPHLSKKYGWNDATTTFHKFWHFAPHVRDGHGEYTPFHGHIIGLHPGCGWMIKTPTGQQLMANWLMDLWNNDAYRRVIHALYVSIHHYVSRLSELKNDRK